MCIRDRIQASAGGIQLDTMFVDEGFGSLDEESLEQAMKALNGLTEGNRLVGIISHVQELKARIETVSYTHLQIWNINLGTDISGAEDIM